MRKALILRPGIITLIAFETYTSYSFGNFRRRCLENYDRLLLGRQPELYSHQLPANLKGLPDLVKLYSKRVSDYFVRLQMCGFDRLCRGRGCVELILDVRHETAQVFYIDLCFIIIRITTDLLLRKFLRVYFESSIF